MVVVPCEVARHAARRAEVPALVEARGELGVLHPREAVGALALPHFGADRRDERVGHCDALPAVLEQPRELAERAASVVDEHGARQGLVVVP
eukprot:240985-Chlamydomonas_euryale.AAC.2